MMSSRSLAGPSYLGDIPLFDFFKNWSVIKNRIPELQAMGLKITGRATVLGRTIANLERRGGPDAQRLIAELQPQIREVNDDIAKYWKVKGYIDQYLPEWMKQDAAAKSPAATAPIVPAGTVPTYQQPTVTEEITGWVKSWMPGLSGHETGLGIVPIGIALVATAGGISALAYVVTVGMALYQKYQYQTSILDMVKAKGISDQQAKVLLEAGGPELATGGGITDVIKATLTSASGNIGMVVGIALVGYVAFLMLPQFLARKAVN